MCRLYGLPDKTIAPLPRIQNLAARILSRTKKHDHITILKNLHWLPVKQRIDFKIPDRWFMVWHQPTSTSSVWNVSEPQVDPQLTSHWCAGDWGSNWCALRWFMVWHQPTSTSSVWNVSEPQVDPQLTSHWCTSDWGSSLVTDAFLHAAPICGMPYPSTSERLSWFEFSSTLHCPWLCRSQSHMFVYEMFW
jgi:hypothetical protein